MGSARGRVRPRRPPTIRRGLVGPVIVEKQVNIQLGSYAAVDLIDQLSELLRPRPRFTAPEEFTGPSIQGREVGHRAMPRVVVRAPLDLGRIHRWQQLRPVDGVNLRVLINAQHQRTGGSRYNLTSSHTFLMNCVSAVGLNVST